MKGIFAVIVVGCGALLAAGAAQAWTIVLPRAGHVGVGGQAQYGALLKSSQFGRDFGSGGVMAFRLKYRLRYERAIGISFEEIHLDARAPQSDSTDTWPIMYATTRETPVTRTSLEFTTAGLDVYQFYRTRTRTPLYLGAGLGLATHLTAKQADGRYIDPIRSEGIYLSGGGGVEWFVYRSWAVDLSARYMAILVDGQVNHDLHAALGMMFYVAY